jgi:CRISPR-associated endonuclease Csn1
MKKILGLDLGTNSIGWALIEKSDDEKTGKILGAGSRIIPMSQDILGKFDSGVSISQTAERTGYRGNRRLRERHLLRRERLHRILNIIDFLPNHYKAEIDFNKRLGKFLENKEPKIAYHIDTDKISFLFKESFEEMITDFAQLHPDLVKDGKKIPYDWTIYYLRKKALTEKIKKEELAWLILHFNQKRGYYQLRGEENEEKPNKLEEFHSLKIVKVEDSGDRKNKDEVWYNVHLENGWIYRRTSKTPLDWAGKYKEFIVTTDLNDDGTIKKDKEGKEKRSFRSPAENDWNLLKKKTEHDIKGSKKTVGQFIYDALLQNPSQKIKGKLVRTIERLFYKEELKAILEKQQELHEELQKKDLYKKCIVELYRYNETHRNSIDDKDFVHLILNDILFYQRPLKSKKSLISNCKFESRVYVKNGVKQIEPLKCIAKSHPLFQEFRLLKFVQNLHIYKKEELINGKLETDIDITTILLPTHNDWLNLYNWLNGKKEIDQKEILKYPPFNLKGKVQEYRWNYVEDKVYPCNETYYMLKVRLAKVKNISPDFLTKQNEEELWHILYSVEDKHDIEKALQTFSIKKKLDESFIELFKKFPPFKKDYGSYSMKAVRKFLPLMRFSKHWNPEDLDLKTRTRIEKIITSEYDEQISNRVREKSINLRSLEDFKGLPEWLASYIIYDRYSEDADASRWKNPEDIKLLAQHSLRNPIVEQIINETLQVVREIWVQYGKSTENFFNEIHIELGREMKNTKDDRIKISRQNTENENTHLRLKALLMEMLNDTETENVRPYSPMQLDILKVYEEAVLSAEGDNIPEDILKISKQSQPSSSELIKYKLWLQQKYRSPYTGKTIPLNKLFTPAYEIEHIIPKSRFFDDSFSNKVICEASINSLKANRTGMEFILQEGGRIVEIGMAEKVTLLTKNEYEIFIKDQYKSARGKMKRLLMEDIPDTFIQRQLNDTRYISKVVKVQISKIVKEDGEQESTSKHVIICSGTITSKLKQDWALNDIWNEIITPRFIRLNQMTGNTGKFGDINPKTQKFLPTVPLEFQRGFNKKRIDHRHHALDAIVIACATRDHINYLNNESALGKNNREEKDKKRYDLRYKLCFKKYDDVEVDNYKWLFKQPWETFAKETKETINDIAVSFKKNTRVINKTINYYQSWIMDNETMTKKLVKQTKGDNWAIRKSMHKDTISGLVKLRFSKTVQLSAALNDLENIVDQQLKKQIKNLSKSGYSEKQIVKYFKENNYNGLDVSTVEVYYWAIDKNNQGTNAASRVSIDITFSSEIIKCITDTGIQKIMLRHLEKYNEYKGEKMVEHPELAFSPDGIDELNRTIKELNNNKPHHPIYKVRTYEPKGNKFNIGTSGNKKDKYAEAAKGTNLFFGIYIDNGKRYYESIPLNIVIERQKQGLSTVPELNEKGYKLEMYLSPNDLVYVPTDEDLEAIGDSFKYTRKKTDRVYKVVSFSGKDCFFVRHDIASPIIKNYEFTSSNKMEKSIDGKTVKEVCLKLNIDRLGNIKPA